MPKRMGQVYVLLKKMTLIIDWFTKDDFSSFIKFTSGIELRTSLQTRHRNVVLVCLQSQNRFFHFITFEHLKKLSPGKKALKHNPTCADNVPSNSSNPCPKKQPFKSELSRQMLRENISNDSWPKKKHEKPRSWFQIFQRPCTIGNRNSCHPDQQWTVRMPS